MLAHTQDLPNIFIPIHPFLFAYFSSLIESIENVFPGKVDIGWRSDQAPCLLAALCCPAQAEHTAAIVPAAMVSRSAIESPIVRGKNDIYCPTWENINTIKKSKTNYLSYKQTCTLPLLVYIILNMIGLKKAQQSCPKHYTAETLLTHWFLRNCFFSHHIKSNCCTFRYCP